MGTISDIRDGSAITLAAAAIWDRLNTDRTCLLEVWNTTDHTLRVRGHSHAHGGFAEPPSIEVPPSSVDTFGSQSSGGSIFTGTEGFVTYEIDDLNTTAVIRWNNPFIGGNGCSGGPEGDKAVAFEVTAVCGAGNDAHMKYELRQVRDPGFVRPPDYRLVRLEGYAFDPDHDWFAADPDSGEDRFPHEAMGLHSWWSRSREDNWTTTDPRHTQPLRREISPDYSWYRLEGYLISPHIDRPEGTVPLHSWWSRSRGDNWATTDPRHTNPLRERISPDYGEYRLEGFLFSPLLPQPEHTIPVHSWYSPSRGDNFITTDPRYRP